MLHTFVTYDIRMRTPIGMRTGMLSVVQNEKSINGFLEILHHKEPFEGTIDGQGNCTFTGKMKTMFNTICYTATGRMDDKELRLVLTDEKHTFEVRGTATEAVGNA